MFSALRLALRLLRRDRVATFSILLVLSLGLGSAMILAVLLDAVALHPIRVPDLNRIVRLHGAEDLPNEPWTQWWGQAKGIEALSHFDVGGANLRAESPYPQERVAVAVVDQPFFRVFAVRPVMGQDFSSLDGARNVSQTVLSYSFWTQYYHRAPVIGQTIQVNGLSSTIVGVAPAGFAFPGATSLWVLDPNHQIINTLGRDDRPGKLGRYWGHGNVVRLKPDVTIAEAQEQVRALQKRLTVIFAKTFPTEGTGMPVWITPLTQTMYGNLQPAFLAAFVAGLLLLFSAAMNAGGVFMARTYSRKKELAVRVAMGSSRLQVFELVIAEAAVLCGVATLLGGGFALAGLSVIRQEFSSQMTPLANIGPYPEVLAVVAGFVLAAFVILCTLGLLHIRTSQLGEQLKLEGQRTARSVDGRSRGFLVFLETAITFFALVVTLFLLKQVTAVMHIDPGFSTRSMVTAQIASPPRLQQNLSTPAARQKLLAAFLSWQRNLLAEVKESGMANSAVLASSMPLSEHGPSILFLSWKTKNIGAEFTNYTGDYFNTMGIPVLHSLPYSPQEPILIVNQALANNLAQWLPPGTSVLGQRILIEGDSVYRRIVAVVGNVRGDYIWSPAQPAIYFPYSQTYHGYPLGNMVLVVRTTHPQATQATLKWITRDLPTRAQVTVFDGMTGSDLLRHAMEGRSVAALIGSIFAIIILLISSIGLYSVLNYLVSTRVFEIALRRAFGAPDRSILVLVLQGGLLIVSGGVLLGMVLAIGAERYILHLYPYAAFVSEPTLLLAGGISFLAAALACLIPAGRALAVSPAQVLKEL